MRRKDRHRAVAPLLAEFMPDVNPGDRCYSLSGGEQQLVSILRSTTIEPDVMLLDEPFSALDQQRSWHMALHVERIWTARPIPTVFVSHDVDEAILLADEVLLMSNRGKIEGAVRNTLPRPRKIDMLTSSEHLRCRHEVISFLRQQNSNGNGPQDLS
jgi:NitT/TauT family transport system ATP-binding protein